MIQFKKIFGILLVLASGTVAAMDSNSRAGKRRILEDDAGVPVAAALPVAALPVAVPVVPAPVKANGGARRAKLGSFKRQRAAEPLPLPVAVPELDTGDLTKEDFALDPAELDLLKEVKRRLAQNEASRKWREDNPEHIRATNKAWCEANPQANKERAKAWREVNSEKIKAYLEANKERNKAYREANKEHKRATDKAWREANTERKRATDKAWCEANKEHKRATNKAYREKRKAKKEAAAPKE